MRPATHWDAVAVERLAPDSLGQVERWPLHIGASFSDVPPASPFSLAVETLLHRSVVAGCGPGAFCPGTPVTREQMSVFLLGTLDPALSPPPCVPPDVFADVPETSPFCRWVEELSRRGISGGCGGGNYCPDAAVTREQMAAFLCTTFGLTLYGL